MASQSAHQLRRLSDVETILSNPDSSVQDLGTAILPDGCVVWCRESVCDWRLIRSSTTTPDGIDVVAPNAGPGRWFRSPLITGAFQVTAAIDYPFIRFGTDPNSVPTPVEGGPSVGWFFSVGGLAVQTCFVESPLEPTLDRTKPIVIGIGWVPSVTEPGKVISWHADIGAESVGHDVTATDATGDAANVPYTTAPLYVHSGITIAPAVFANPAIDELHVKLSRVASANDPVSQPALHHIAIIQQLLH